MKIGEKRRERSKRNFHIIRPREMIKINIIIMVHCRPHWHSFWYQKISCMFLPPSLTSIHQPKRKKRNKLRIFLYKARPGILRDYVEFSPPKKESKGKAREGKKKGLTGHVQPNTTRTVASRSVGEVVDNSQTHTLLVWLYVCVEGGCVLILVVGVVFSVMVHSGDDEKKMLRWPPQRFNGIEQSLLGQNYYHVTSHSLRLRPHHARWNHPASSRRGVPCREWRFRIKICLKNKRKQERITWIVTEVIRANPHTPSCAKLCAQTLPKRITSRSTVVNSIQALNFIFAVPLQKLFQLLSPERSRCRSKILFGMKVIEKWFGWRVVRTFHEQILDKFCTNFKRDNYMNCIVNKETSRSSILRTRLRSRSVISILSDVGTLKEREKRVQRQC